MIDRDRLVRRAAGAATVLLAIGLVTWQFSRPTRDAESDRSARDGATTSTEATLTAPRGGDPVAASMSTTIAVCVVDASTKAPITSARLELGGTDGTRYEGTSGTNGCMEIATTGERTLVVLSLAAVGFSAPDVSESSLVIDMSGSGVRSPLQLEMWPAHRLACRVRDSAGMPIAGATARIGGSDEVLMSDAAGLLAIQATAGSVLEVVKAGYLPWRRNLTTGDINGVELLVDMKPFPASRQTVTGAVTDEVGRAVASARVAGWSRSPATPYTVETTTDDHGRFSLDLPVGPHVVTAEKEGFSPDFSDIDGAARDVRLRLRRQSPLHGRVVDPEHRPVSRFRIVVFYETGGHRTPILERTFVSDEGRFTIDGIPDVPLLVVAYAPGLGKSPAVPVVSRPSTGDGDEVVMTLSAGASVIGRVTKDDGRVPVAGAVVRIVGDISGLTWTTTKRDGSFELIGLSPGRMSIDVTATGFDLVVRSGIELAESDRLDIGRIDLRVAGGAPSIEYAGIGARVTPAADRLTLAEVLDGGGAQQAGLLVGEHVVEVDGRTVSSHGAEAAVEALRGLAGTSVHVLIVGLDGQQRLVSITRRLVRP